MIQQQRGADVVSPALAKILGRHAERDDVSARVFGAVAAGALIVLAAYAVPDVTPFLSRRQVIAYPLFLPALALVPARRFTLAQAIAAVGVYVAARICEDMLAWEAGVLLAEQALFFWILWRAPIHLLNVRRWLIAITMFAIAPACWYLFKRCNTDLLPFLGGWRHFVLLLALTRSDERTALTTARNIAMPFFMSAPLPLEKANTADRRLVTLVTGGVLFAIGIVASYVLDREGSFSKLEWDDGAIVLAGTCMLRMLVATLRVVGFGCMLMGHCYLLGIRIAAPVTLPLRWTNLAEAWPGTGVYMYRLAYDGFYKQFWLKADKRAIPTILKITALFLSVGYIHCAFGPPQMSWTAAELWTVLGLATGLTIVFLRHRAAVRMKAYLKDKRRPERSRWALALAPLCVLAVLAFRGLIDDGLEDAGFWSHMARLFGAP